jgi:hypothetical protein
MSTHFSYRQLHPMPVYSWSVETEMHFFYYYFWDPRSSLFLSTSFLPLLGVVRTLPERIAKTLDGAGAGVGSA